MPARFFWLGDRLFDLRPQLREEAGIKDIFLHLLNAGDRHDAVYWRRKDVECACFSQRTLCFLADSKSLAGRQTAIVRPAHDYFRLERI